MFWSFLVYRLEFESTSRSNSRHDYNGCLPSLVSVYKSARCSKSNSLRQLLFIQSRDDLLVELFAKIDFQLLEQLTRFGFKNSKGIEWIYSPPAGSHFGGVFEIVVKSFKRAFLAIYKRAELTMTEFITATTEVEFILNSRPLTTSNTEDFPVLTPAHFVIAVNGGHSLCPPMRQRF